MQGVPVFPQLFLVVSKYVYVVTKAVVVVFSTFLYHGMVYVVVVQVAEKLRGA